jgi:hypothetical protein
VFLIKNPVFQRFVVVQDVYPIAWLTLQKQFPRLEKAGLTFESYVNISPFPGRFK